MAAPVIAWWFELGRPESIALAVGTYLTLALLEFFWRFIKTPALLEAEMGTQLAGATQRIGELQATRPKVSVSADGPTLTVENTGGVAEFTARLVVVRQEGWPEVLKPGDFFDALWGTTRTRVAQIPQHALDHILIAEDSRNLNPGKVRLRFFSQSDKQPGYISTNTPGAVLLFRVSIYATPAVLGGPIVYEVELTAQGCRIIPPVEGPAGLPPATLGPSNQQP